MFSQVFPLAGFLAICERSLALIKLIALFGNQRRSMPSISMGAGIFLDLLELMGVVSVFVNTALIYFTSPITKKYFETNLKITSENFLMWLVVCEHVILITKYAISILFGSDDKDKFLR